MVDFVLVLVLLLPLVLALVQVCLVAYVRTTLTAAATEGARYGATWGRGPAEAVARTRARSSGVLDARFVRDVTAEVGVRDGLPVLEVHVRAVIGALGPWAPRTSADVTAHAIIERR